MRALPIASALLSAALPLAVLGAQSGPSDPPKNATTSVTLESATIQNGQSALPATIATPAGNGKHAAILIVAVGTDQSTALGKQLAQAFADKGMLALTYEASSANASDAVAAIQRLEQRGDVKPADIGIIGVGSAVAVLPQVVRSKKLRYAIAVTATQDPATDPVSFGKLSQQVLVVHGMDNPFSEASDRYSQSVHDQAHNVTLWPTPDSDIATLDSENSILLGRVTTWAAARSQ